MFFDGITEKNLLKISFNFDASICILNINLVCHVCVRACMRAQLLQLCLTLCDPRDCSPPGFSVHGILQARILDLLHPVIKPASPASPALQAESLPLLVFF